MAMLVPKLIAYAPKDGTRLMAWCWSIGLISKTGTWRWRNIAWIDGRWSALYVGKVDIHPSHYVLRSDWDEAKRRLEQRGVFGSILPTTGVFYNVDA